MYESEVYEQYKSLGGVRNKIVKLFPPKKGDLILDVGCGDGYFSFALAKTSYVKVIGIDRTRSWINNAKVYSKEQPLKGSVLFKQVDILNNNFENNSFDMVTNFLSLCDIMQDKNTLKRYLKECKRILKPGGKLLIADQFRSSKEPNNIRLGFKLQKEFGYCFQEKSFLVDVIKENGLTVIKESIVSTKRKPFSIDQVKDYIKEESYFFEKEYNKKVDLKIIFKKYESDIKKYGLLIDSKISVLYINKHR